MKIHTFTIALWSVLMCLGTALLGALTPLITTSILVTLGAPVITALYFHGFTKTIHQYFEKESK